jgi:[ribosomal protein S5]-alanine N-acetyltransferase
VRTPELLTPRLRLRALATRDIRAVKCLLADPDVQKTTLLVEALPGWLAWINAYLQVRMSASTWAIANRQTDECLGTISVDHGAREFPTVGFELGRAHWNQGIMTEALGAVLQTLWKAGERGVIGIVFEENLASQRVFEKSGFRLTGRDTFEGHKCVFFEIRAEETTLARAS